MTTLPLNATSPDLAVAQAPGQAPATAVLRHVPWARWALLIGATGLAFNGTFRSAAQQAHQGAPLAYLFLLPAWAGVLAVGTTLRRRHELPIHDRQVDWIVATALAVGLWMLDVLLAPRLGATAELVRVDVFGMLLFVVVGSVLLFGTRPTGRYWATWLFLAACWPLAYQLVGAALGGSTTVYAALNVALTAVALGLARGGWRSGPAVAAATLAIGLVGVVAVGRLSQVAQLVAELLPAAVAMAVVVGIGLTTRWRDAAERRWVLAQAGPSRPPTVTRPRAASVAVVLLALVVLWRSDMTPPTVAYQALPKAGAGWTAKPVVPAGWRTVGKSTQYSWVPRYFGLGAEWQRFVLQPVTGPTTSGSAAGNVISATGPTTSSVTMVVDALTVPNAGTLGTYPAVGCYKLNTPYLSSATTVDLGHGVAANLYYANSAAAQSAVDANWTLLTWVWKVPDTASGDVQRVTVFAADGSAGRVGVPKPASPASNDGIRTTFTDILRGASTVGSPSPDAAALQQLTTFSKALVAQQTAGRVPR